MSVPTGSPDLRLATAGDEAAIRACAEAAHAQHVAAMGRRPAPMDADFPAQIAAGKVHVATDAAGTVIGYAVFYPKGGAMHLESVAVLPSAAGRGIGKALITRCEAAAREAGLPAIELYTHAKMTANLAMYPHLGFREIGRRQEDGFDRVFFRREIAKN